MLESSPPPRAGHSMSLYNGTAMTIFGGEDSNNAQNNMLVLNVASKVVEEISTSGDPPAPRFNHAGLGRVVGCSHLP